MGRIKKGVESELPHMEWVVGEISQVQENASGHCYIELVEYRQSDKAVVAKARAVIWDSEYRMIKPFFHSLTGSRIKAGMNVLVKVKVTYSVIYGLTLVVYDIDPSYTIGEMELKRQQTTIELIASENYVSRSIMKLQGSILTNKYAEGYPGRRYYGGCVNVDEVEETMLKLRTKIADYGYAFINIEPIPKKNNDDKIINIKMLLTI